MKPQQLPIGDLLTSVSVAQKYEKAVKKQKETSCEDDFVFQCRGYKLPPFMAAPNQCFFAKTIGRQWRFDVAWPIFKLAVEIEGLVVRRIVNKSRKSGFEYTVGGGHASIEGIKEDMEKYNCAALLGWHVLRFEQTMVKSGEAIATTQRMLNTLGWTRSS